LNSVRVRRRQNLRWRLRILIWGLWLAMFLAFVGGWAITRRPPNLPSSAWDLTSVLMFGGMLLLLAVLSMLLIDGLFKRSLFRPLEQLRTRAERLRQGDLAVRLRVNQDDDLGQVTTALDEMVSQLRTRAEQQTTETEAIRVELGQRNQTLEALEQAYGSLQRRNQLLTQILEVGHSLQRNLNPRTLFQEMVQAVHTSLGFEIVVLNLVDEDGRHVRARAHVGLDEEGRRLLESAVYTWEEFAIFLQERFRVGHCYFFPHDAFDRALEGPESGSGEVSNSFEADFTESSWHPDDALFVPIALRSGQIGGVFSLGQPLNGRRPDRETLRALEIFAAQAAAAIENARLYGQVQQDLVERRRAAEELQELNEMLEVRVQERTVELAQTNESLQVEISERKRAEEQIKTSLSEKEVLLKEIHHRVKNNLQVISSLLNLQSGYVEDEGAREIFLDSQNRVRSMALVHEKLYRSQDLARVDLADYIQNLATFLFRSYRTGIGGVTLSIKAEDVSLGIDAAVPCGLILNELISNALKYAFPNGQTGEVCVQLHAHDDQQVTLIVADNGVGISPDLDLENTTSLGLQLVNTLTSQLDGTLDISSDAGTEFKITFPAP
jgi:two-component sensor histidine kinase/HAMP domain-containing protein